MVAVALILLVSFDPPMLEFIEFDPHTLITLTAAVIVGREITISALREWMAEMARARQGRRVVDGQAQDHLPDDRPVDDAVP